MNLYKTNEANKDNNDEGISFELTCFLKLLLILNLLIGASASRKVTGVAGVPLKKNETIGPSSHIVEKLMRERLFLSFLFLSIAHSFLGALVIQILSKVGI